MTDPLIDFVIAVHDPTRPVRRALDSLASGFDSGLLRVTVVCHGIVPKTFATEQAAFRSFPVRWLHFVDGIPSPAGPFNYGLSKATASYVAVMGSDDFFDPGAIAALLNRIRAYKPDVLIFPLRQQDQKSMPNPLVRRGRQLLLDPVKDRLAYRTAPLALVRRTLVEQEGLAFTPRLRVGEDVNFSARLWFSGAKIAFFPADPGYVIGKDARQRVTSVPLGMEEELAPFVDLLQRPWLRKLSLAQKQSLTVKTVRIHLFGALFRRNAEQRWALDEISTARSFLRHCLSVAPGTLGPFSRSDRYMLDTLLDDAAGPREMAQSVEKRLAAGRFVRWFPKNPFQAFNRESTVVRLIRYMSWPR